MIGTPNFGLGNLVLIPSGANPTPIQVGILKDISFDISVDLTLLDHILDGPRGSVDASMR